MPDVATHVGRVGRPVDPSELEDDGLLEPWQVQPKSPRYLSTDPNAGRYLSTDPNAGTPMRDPNAPTSVLGRFFAPLLPSETLSDYWEGPKYALRHPIESAKMIGSAIAVDPVGAIPIVGNVKRAIGDAAHGNYAGAAGELVAGALTAKGVSKLSGGAIPDVTTAAKTIARSVARGAGSAVAGTGRTLEAIGSSEPVRHLGTWSAVGSVVRGNPAEAAILAAAPPALEISGRSLRRLGSALKGLGASSDAAPTIERYAPNTGGRIAVPTQPAGWTRRSVEVPGSSYTGEIPIRARVASGDTTTAAPDPLRDLLLDVEPSRWTQGDPADLITSPGRTPIDWAEPRVDVAPVARSVTAGPSRMVDLDAHYGPGVLDTQGRSAQAAPMKGEPGYMADLDPSHQLYDPQTSSDAIRALRDAAEDPAVRDFYSRALDQRNRIGLALEGLRGSAPSGIRLLKVQPFAAPRR